MQSGKEKECFNLEQTASAQRPSQERIFQPTRRQLQEGVAAARANADPSDSADRVLLLPYVRRADRVSKVHAGQRHLGQRMGGADAVSEVLQQLPVPPGNLEQPAPEPVFAPGRLPVSDSAGVDD